MSDKMLWLVLILFSVYSATAQQKPNVLFIVADDLGWNDVGWRNSEIITPHLDKLANNGIVLNQTYVAPMCSPTRSSFMSGFFPYHTGMQHNVVRPNQGFGLPLHLTLLPEVMRNAGYATHMLGKWHLGFCNWTYTPTRRGFDTFYGYYCGAEDYFEHTRSGGLDFRDNEKPVHDKNGTYSTYLFGDRATEIIKRHNPTKPFFMYLPFQSVHAPLQVPKKYEDMYKHIKDKKRRVFSGMVTAMDDAVGAVIKTLETKGVLNNTLIVFTTDNGGPVYEGANNWPLRGAKTTLWEGGTRGAAFVYGNMLKKTKFTYEGLTHAVDWLPTFAEFAGAKLPKYKIDGMSMWTAITQNKMSPRKRLVYNLNVRGDKKPAAAIRVGNWKLIVGDPGKWNDWYPVPTDKQEKHRKGDFYSHGKPMYMLFNIKDDPTEHVDLSKKYPDKLKEMITDFKVMAASEVKAMNPPPNPKSNPKHWGGVWSPGWC